MLYLDKILKKETAMSGKIRKELLEAKQKRDNIDSIYNKSLAILSSNTSAENKNRLIEMLRSYAFNNGCSLMSSPAKHISPEHKLLIRDDCSGNISNVINEYMSVGYLAAKRKKKQSDTLYNIKLYEQALQNSAYGHEMKDYPSYKAVEFPLLINLIDQKISPSIIRSMKISDFRDFIREYCYEEFSQYHEKKGFIKVFIKHNADSFYELLCSNAVHPAYVEKLIENMQTKGNAESFSFNYKGQTITGPGFDIDHKNPIYCPNDIKSYHEVNHPRSLAVVEKNTHRLKHRLERAINTDDDIKMYEKIILPTHCAAMLNFESYITYDFDNPRRQINQQQPAVSNLIFLNKINLFNSSINIEDENTHEKTKRKYINNQGGRK